MKTIVLIDKNGKEAMRFSSQTEEKTIIHDGRTFKFGVAKLNGEHHFYDISIDTPPMGGPAR